MAAGTTAVVQLVPRHHPLQFPISKQSFKFKPQSLSKPSLFPISCSSSSPPSNAPVQQPADAPTPIRGCKACGREEVERGCNGEGRIQGGIATVPGFGWWPIKAYRPCPGLVASGGRYKRYGQTMDEVGFGSSVDMAMAKETNSKDE